MDCSDWLTTWEGAHRLMQRICRGAVLGLASAVRATRIVAATLMGRSLGPERYCKWMQRHLVERF